MTMTLLSALPTAFIGASAPSGPFEVASKLWGPEFRTDLTLIRDKLNDSIQSDKFPVRRKNIIGYLGKKRPETVRGGIYVKHVLNGYIDDSDKRLLAIRAGEIRTNDMLVAPGLFVLFQAALGVVIGGVFVTATMGRGPEMLFPVLENTAYVGFTLLAGSRAINAFYWRPNAWREILNDFSDIALISVAAMVATDTGNREQENHFNALAVQKMYDL